MDLRDVYNSKQFANVNITFHGRDISEVRLREFIPGIYQMLICLWIVGKGICVV